MKSPIASYNYTVNHDHVIFSRFLGKLNGYPWRTRPTIERSTSRQPGSATTGGDHRHRRKRHDDSALGQRRRMPRRRSNRAIVLTLIPELLGEIRPPGTSPIACYQTVDLIGPARRSPRWRFARRVDGRLVGGGSQTLTTLSSVCASAQVGSRARVQLLPAEVHLDP